MISKERHTDIYCEPLLVFNPSCFEDMFQPLDKALHYVNVQNAGKERQRLYTWFPKGALKYLYETDLDSIKGVSTLILPCIWRLLTVRSKWSRK